MFRQLESYRGCLQLGKGFQRWSSGWNFCGNIYRCISAVGGCKILGADLLLKILHRNVCSVKELSLWCCLKTEVGTCNLWKSMIDYCFQICRGFIVFAAAISLTGTALLTGLTALLWFSVNHEERVCKSRTLSAHKLFSGYYKPGNHSQADLNDKQGMCIHSLTFWLLSLPEVCTVHEWTSDDMNAQSMKWQCLWI